MSDSILIVDDEREIADLVALYLRNENYEVHTCYSGTEALTAIDAQPYDLAILDLMLPGVSGEALCQHIRRDHLYPIIMLTAKDGEMDKITGLTLGADDYLTKPFRPLELVARVKAQLRRYKRYNDSSQADPEVIVHSGLVINVSTHEVMLDERPLSLTPTEFAILRLLCQRRGQVVSADELFHEVWGYQNFAKTNNTITVHIRHLRQKMNDPAENPRYIKTVWGVGYKVDTQI